MVLDALKLTPNSKVALRLSTVAAAQMSLKLKSELFALCFTSGGGLEELTAILLSPTPAERLKSPVTVQLTQLIVRSVDLVRSIDLRIVLINLNLK